MKIAVQFKAGGSFVGLPPVFSPEFEYIYVAWKNQVLGYSIKTGVQTAVFDGLEKEIIGFALHDYNNFQCITACSFNGEVITWKVDTHLKIFKKKVECSCVRSFHLLPSESNELVALVALSFKTSLSFCLYNLEDSAVTKYDFGLNPSKVYVDVCSDQFFAVAQKRTLYVIQIKNKDTRKYQISDRKFTCLACHPEAEAILTGDNTGRIVLWRNLFSENVSKAVFHWHTLPVRCLSFSTTGSCFYSGGEEAVLVQWQIDYHLEKKFLPRLSSTITQLAISGNNNFIAVATVDNRLKIIDSRFASVSLIQNLVIGDNFNSGVVCDFRTRTIIMNGNVGQIQFYSPWENALVYSVDVVGQNKISNERNCKIENTNVSKVAVSKNGLWMSTVEVRRDPEYSLEQRLKFWSFDLSAQNFQLNTSIEDPHENEINALKFQPNDTNALKCISVGEDKKFKIWFLDEIEMVEGGKKNIWTCFSVGYYHDLNCKGLSFSADGSLLAVGFKNVLTTWLPDTCHLKCSLSHPVCNEEITHIEFGNGLQCHLLVAASKKRLSVWNLLTLTMIWTVPVDVSILIADSVTTNMAVFTENKAIFVFSPLSPQPIFASKEILAEHKSIYGAAFVPSKFATDGTLSWYERSPIYFVDARKELHYIGREEDAVETLSDIENSDVSKFSMTLPKEQKENGKNRKSVNHLFFNNNGQRNLEKYLEAPIETMIPIRLMCGSLLRSMVLQKA